MDTLITLNDNGTDTKQLRSFCCPVAGAAHAIILAGKDDGRDAVFPIVVCGFVNRRLLAFRIMAREPAFNVGCHQVANAAVGKRAAAHHPVIAAACAVGIEITRCHAVFLEVFAGRARGGDGTCG